MSDNSNSINTLLPDLLRLFNNVMESNNKFNEAVTSNKEFITIDLLDSENNMKRVTIPSFGYLKTSLERLDTNVQNLAGVGENNTQVKLPDGSYKKVLTSNIPVEANDITKLNSVNNFDVKSNFFFENFINPLMYITFDISGQVPVNTERIMTKRFMLDLTTESKKSWFNTNINGKANLEYKEFLNELIKNNIQFVLDEDTLDVPPRELQYYGDFNVIKITDVNHSEVKDSQLVSSKKKSIKLNKLTYNDKNANYADTMGLKIGDTLLLNSEVKDTKYKITAIDSSTNSIIVELVEGYQTISIGANVLSFLSNIDENVNVQVPIGFNEYNVVFIKAIDPVSKIPSKNWSPGSAFYTNELEITDELGNIQTLNTYYKDKIVNFSSVLLAMSKDKIPPSTLGIKPNSPTIDSNALKVVSINDQITNSTVINDLEKLDSDKQNITSEIKELDNAIANKRSAIGAKNYSNNMERDTDMNELSALIAERNSKSELYSSVVKSISTMSESENISNVAPKYRVRGFFPFPEPKTSEETGDQQIVQFLVSYRYVTLNGSANKTEEITFTDGEIERRGAFSNWVEYKTEVRKRIYNTSTGKYEWAIEDLEDADQTNINTIDIPINKGEAVEIRVKSISEAGWPSNPIHSDFSEIIRVPFDNTLPTNNNVTQIIENNKAELTKVKLQEELRTQGIEEHVKNAFIANNKTFLHVPTDIASGFLTPEQTPITLFDKLVDITNQLKEFNEILKKVKGTLVVKMVDELGNDVIVKKDQLNTFFAGYYADIVEDMQIKKGVIITKTYFLTLENVAATNLELISRLYGSSTFKVKESSIGEDAAPDYYNNKGTYDKDDSDYNNNKKYDIVPLVIINPNDVKPAGTERVGQRPPFQSPQIKSQFIYGRFKDVAGEEKFYINQYPTRDGEISDPVGTDDINAGRNKIENVNEAENTYSREGISMGDDTSNFIWGGSFDGTGKPTRAAGFDEQVNDNGIEVHLNHPYLKSLETFKKSYTTITGKDWIDGDTNYIAAAKEIFRQSKFAPLESNTTLGKVQPSYLYDPTANRTIKTSFDTNDQYLLGENSCGSYMFIASDSYDNLVVDGKTKLSTKTVEFGAENALTIPVIFQFRMTDFWGDDIDGVGHVAGDMLEHITNVTYAKRMGFDIYDNSDNIFSFDVEIYAKYKSDNLNLEKIPAKTLQSSLSDMTKTLSTLSPSIVETSINN